MSLQNEVAFMLQKIIKKVLDLLLNTLFRIYPQYQFVEIQN